MTNEHGYHPLTSVLANANSTQESCSLRRSTSDRRLQSVSNQPTFAAYRSIWQKKNSQEKIHWENNNNNNYYNNIILSSCLISVTCLHCFLGDSAVNVVAVSWQKIVFSYFRCGFLPHILFLCSSSRSAVVAAAAAQMINETRGNISCNKDNTIY